LRAIVAQALAMSLGPDAVTPAIAHKREGPFEAARKSKHQSMEHAVTRTDHGPRTL
jgi:hypothetical protein